MFPYHKYNFVREWELISWIFKTYGPGITEDQVCLGISVLEKDTIVNYISLSCTEFPQSTRSSRCKECKQLRKKIMDKKRHAKHVP